MDDAWHWSPQEWWQCWSFKYGKRAKAMENGGMSDSEAAQMRAELDEQIRRENSTNV